MLSDVFNPILVVNWSVMDILVVPESILGDIDWP